MSMNLNKMRIQFLIAIYGPHVKELYFSENPIKIGSFGSRDITILVLLKTIKHKGNVIIYCIFILKINISEFRLIFVDHITNVVPKISELATAAKLVFLRNCLNKFFQQQ